MSNCPTLSALSEQIHNCRACPRLIEWCQEVARKKRAAFVDQQYWGRPVAGFGDPNAQLLVLGLAPAAHGANRTGRMFTGDKSGEWLFEAMFKSGFSNRPNSSHLQDGLELSNAYITATLKCAPPANKPTLSERNQCLGYLSQEIALLPRVKVIIVLGRFAYDGLKKYMNFIPGTGFGHGNEQKVDFMNRQFLIICSYHPSQQNTFTKKLTKDMFQAPFERAKEAIS